jgi:hypothetical protein
LKDQGVDGIMGSEWILGKLAEGGVVECIKLAQDRGQWQTVVNAVMNLCFQASRSQLCLYTYC